MADPGDTTNPFASSSPAAASWDDLPDDFFLSASISSPPAAPAPIPSTSPRPAATPPQPPHLLHPSHSLPTFPAAASRPAAAAAAAEVWPPPPGPHHSGSLPEFAAAPASRAHRPPARAAVRDDRPPPLELRPRPPRESQARAALRMLACCRDASRDGDGGRPRLWAAGEAGVRAWDLADAFRSPTSRQRWGDEAAAPFRESRTQAALCLTADPGRGVVWSGHTDGRIMGWRADPGPEAEECLAWEAHRGPVFALAVSPYGDLWSGSEGGVIKVWYGEAIEKSLVSQREEKRKTSFLVERSSIDLRDMVGLEGSPNGEWWLDVIGQILKGHSFVRVGSRQMAGLIIAVWVRINLKQFIGDIDNAAVACGLGRAIGKDA
nr:unnamed protein product [Digitaria exilis]